MRMTARMLSVALLLAALGCGTKEEPKPADKPLTPDPLRPPGVVADKDPEPHTPKDPPAVWVMDPAQHKIPRYLAEGKLAGGDFKTTTARIKGGTLTLATAPNRFFALEFQLSPGQGLENRKLVVRPDEQPGPNVPVVVTKSPAASGGMPVDLNLVNGFALTLELGPRAAGKVPGKVYLCMPGEDKSFVAGEFTADWERLDTDPPGPEQAPYVQGKLVVAGVPTPVMKAGYLGQVGTAFVHDSQELSLEGPNAALFTRSVEYAPRATTIHAMMGKDSPARYEHVKLPPGRYFVYLTAHKEVPPPPKGATPPPPEVWAVGKWVSVAEKGELTVDLALDAAEVGTVEAKAPTGMGKVTVMLAPVDGAGTAVDDGLFQGAALSLGAASEAKDGKAAFARITPGKYEARAYEQPTPNDPMRPVGTAQTVDVVAGKPATVDLTAKK